VKLRPLERAAFFKGWAEQKFKGLIQGGSGAFGNARTRIERSSPRAAPTSTEAMPTSTGSSGAGERARSEAARGDLHRIQQLIYDKAIVGAHLGRRLISGVGPGSRSRVSA
jgi:peptide/nickel transport system substrate-binding protein